MSDAGSRFVALSDGRRLSYSVWGTGENGTWIHCHGIPGSRHELAHLRRELAGQGCRVIVPDRPGYGASTPHSDYELATHAEDLEQLANQHELTRFALSGFSGGGVFALTAAHYLTGRVSRLAIAATPAAPLMRTPFAHASELTGSTWRAALHNPQALAQDLEALTGCRSTLAQALISAAGDVEGRFLSSEGMRHHFTANLTAALAQGATTAARALVRDIVLMVNDWKIPPITASLPVDIIHGKDDLLAHQEHQTALLDWLPTARGQTIAGCGHYPALAHLIRKR